MRHLDDIEALLTRERFREARAAVDEALAQTPDSEPSLRWGLELARARLALNDPTVPVDEVIFGVEDLLERADGPECDVARAHSIRVQGFTLKRCAPLFEAAVAEARARCGDEHPVVLVAEGFGALALDDRARARRLFEQAIAIDPGSSLARYGLADLLYVLGDFAGCQAELDRIGEGDARWLRAARLRASCFAAAGDAAAEARQWEAVVARSAGGDVEQQDRAALALALAAAGRRPDALEQLRQAWRLDPESDSGRYARKRIEYLERAAPGTAVKRLPTFPTTAQKWNYCGPAVLELCLRYLDLDLDQDAIAEQVKRERGTPMYEIVTYLRAQGIVARRIEATPDRLRAAIDLGLPVIVQEEYSTTSHVAVITGYDESLGLFVAADPATHRPLLKSFEWTEHAGTLFGSGGVIVLGRPRSDGLAALEARADELGLVEARHLVLLDECDRRRPQAGSGAPDDAALEEVIRLCDEALELSPRFKLAFHRRFDTWAHLYRLRGLGELRSRLLASLHGMRTLFRDDEWPHQLHAHWLFDEGRVEEAFVEYFEASRRDPADANNLQAMGECSWLAGDLGAAERHMLAALAAEPFHARANENLAAVYLRQLQQLDQDGAQPGAAMTMEPARLRRQLDREPDDLRRRALHFNAVARGLNPANPFNHEVAGDLLARGGDWAGSAEAYGASRELAPERSWALWGLARAFEHLDRADEARALLEQGTELCWHQGRAWLELAGFLSRRGDAAGAADVLRRGLEALEQGREQLVAPLFDRLAELESEESAAARLRELAEQRIGDGGLLNEVAWVLDNARQRGHAVALFRHVVDASPRHVQALYRLGKLLCEEPSTHGEGVALLERALELDPEAIGVREELAWTCLECEPERGLALLEGLSDLQDAYIHATRAALLGAMGREAEAAAALQLALEAIGAPAAGYVELARWHLDAQRFDHALELARRIFEHRVPDQLRDQAEGVWLSAFRIAGATREILTTLRERCAAGVPEHLAYDVFYGCETLDPELAGRAALTCCELATTPEQRIEWRIRAAEVKARQGDSTMLDQLPAEAGKSSRAWAALAGTYDALHRYDEANEAARRAIDASTNGGGGSLEALSAMQEACVRLGDLEGAFRYARELIDRHPYEHHGSERLGALLALTLEVEPALEHTARAVAAAPYCQNAHRARALALFVAGDHEGARRHAERCLAIEPPTEPDPPDESVLILRALDGDVGGVERCVEALGRRVPAQLFPGFTARVREIARQRAAGGEKRV